MLDHIFMPIVTNPKFGIGPHLDGFAARKNIYTSFTSLNMEVIRELKLQPEIVLREAVDFFGADEVMWGRTSVHPQARIRRWCSGRSRLHRF